MLILITLISNLLFAEEVLFEIKETAKPTLKTQKQQTQKHGNLPSFYRSKRSSDTFKIAIIKPKKAKLMNKHLKVGDKINLIIPHSIIAFPKVGVPVLGKVINKRGNGGGTLVGEAKLEENSKRILITFNKFSINNKDYKIKAIGIGSDGIYGFRGKYHSQELEYFTGNFISSSIAAYFDSLIPRKSTYHGEQVKDNSINSALKSGLSAGAMENANRFKEKLKNITEFSELSGPLKISAYILNKTH